MRRTRSLLLAAALFGLLPGLSSAGGKERLKPRSGAISQAPVPRTSVHRAAPIHRRGHSYPRGYHYYPHYHYPPPVVISPYGPTYYYQPQIFEVTAPYFCVLHNARFFSRAGMLDHLAGTHKYPLQSAVYFCPDGADICVYPAP